MKIWNLLEYSKEAFNIFVNKFHLPEVFAKILASRPYFSDLILKGNFCKDLSKNFEKNLLIDIDKASERIEQALKNKEKICIFGDYDADGVSSTAMLYLYLKERGGDVHYYIPDRNKEGYGLNVEAIKKIYSSGAKLIITVDNGVTALEEIDFAKTLSLDVVVTDHHKVPEVLPEAVAVVDPHRKDCPSNFKDLAGVGVVFSLILFMEKGKTSTEDLLKKYSLFAMIGTIGDVVPLVSLNRSLVSFGLKALNSSSNLGIEALLKKNSKPRSYSSKKELNSLDVSFKIVPKINAVGRIDVSSKAVDLLVAENKETAEKLATELDNINKKRREIVETVFSYIETVMCTDVSRMYQKILIFYGEDWPAGVIGIIAARLLEIYNKPVIIITKMGDIARGSARSVPGYSIYDALLKSCSSYLLRFGGHPLAAGFDIDISNIARLKKDILNYADESAVPALTLNIDATVDAQEINCTLAEHLEKLEPFGKSNEEPLLKIENAKLKNITVVGSGKHLKLSFCSKSGKSFYALKFFTDIKNFGFKKEDTLDLAVNIQNSVYNGKTETTIILVEAKFSDLDEKNILKQRRIYEDIILEKCDVLENFKKENVPLKREDFILVYRYLKCFNNTLFPGSAISTEAHILYYRLNNPSISYSSFLLILEIFSELELIDFSLKADFCYIKINEKSSKVDLKSSKILQKISSV